jgi:phthalate 4,5-dioxygenase
MLSREDNELMSRVCGDAPMGRLMRRYWLPVVTSADLPAPDSPPVRIRLLGEDLVLFRDTEGRVGLLEEHCAHRGASLAFGRNEDCGLRCVYHGWKYDISGQCVDMPNEPPESTFRQKIRLTSYPILERNGIVWTYLGDPADAAVTAPPDLEWSLVPDSQRYISLRYQKCNWAQALEGGIDSSHTAFLHAHLSEEDDYRDARRRQGTAYKLADKHPRFETALTDYGMLIAARRNAEPGSYYWRITQFLMPFYTIIPPYGPSPAFSGHGWVPVDDETTMVWTVTWHPSRDLREDELTRFRRPAQPWEGGLHLPLDYVAPPSPSKAWGSWRALPDQANDYLIDWERQAATRYSGIPTGAMQDAAMQESMGPIYDRSKEHLGSADAGIARVRNLWLRAAEGLRDRRLDPPGSVTPRSYRVRSASVVLPREADWVTETEAVRGRFGDRNFDAV